MGRGRQKAKQTKVARELKYMSPVTDYRALQQELASGGRHDLVTRHDVVTETRPARVVDDLPATWSSYAADEDDEP
jgi:hypothetical protein